MKYLLGIDIGTTGTKSALFSVDGNLVDISYKGYELSYPHEGWVEQDPEDWWRALIDTVRDIIARNESGKDVVAMSLSTQGGALVLLDDNFNSICPSVSWLDTRANETTELLLQRISIEELYRMSGWSIINGLNFPVIFWFKERRPELYKNARFFASTIDYINYLLTGRFVIDYSNLALTMFMDLKRKDISDSALHIDGIDRSNVPEILPSGQVIGKLTEEAAKELGLSPDVIVVSGAHDQYCANIGAGAVESGDCVLSTGTAWVLLATCDRLYFDERSLSSSSITQSIFPGIHPIEGKYGLMTSVPFGGNSLKWFRDVMKPGTSYEQLDRKAAEAACGSDNLMFIPISSSGSGKGAFLGIDGMHKDFHFIRAVMEGVSFVNRKHLEMIRNAGVQVKDLIMIGGGAKSRLWPQIVADVCNVKVSLPAMSEAACAGAAVLAGTGSGVFSSIEEACKKVTKEKSFIVPNRMNVDVYKALYRKFVASLGYV